MKDGVEYVTDEYWNGKVLYTQLLPITWTAGGYLDFSISPLVVRYSGRVGDYALPFIYADFENSNSLWCGIQNFSGKLRVRMNGSSGANNSKGYIQVWYTK